MESLLKAITLRNLPPKLADTLEQEAAATGQSLNKTVIHLLEKATGVSEPRPNRARHHDLDELAGSWSQKQAQEFELHLEDQRQIDPDLWG